MSRCLVVNCSAPHYNLGARKLADWLREETMRILRAGGVRARRQRVYVLAGNEPIAECYDRAMKVLAWGGEPHCQYVLPLNWLGDPEALHPRYDWTYRLGRDFCRYFNTRGYRSFPLRDYKPRLNEPAPFAQMEAA